MFNLVASTLGWCVAWRWLSSCTMLLVLDQNGGGSYLLDLERENSDFLEPRGLNFIGIRSDQWYIIDASAKIQFAARYQC